MIGVFWGTPGRSKDHLSISCKACNNKKYKATLHMRFEKYDVPKTLELNTSEQPGTAQHT
jgi:hypothetical protein